MAHEEHETNTTLDALESNKERNALIAELENDKGKPLDAFLCTGNEVYTFNYGTEGRRPRYRIDCQVANEKLYGEDRKTFVLQLQDNTRKVPGTTHSMTYANVLYPEVLKGEDAPYSTGDLFEAVIASLKTRKGQCIVIAQ